MGTGDGINEIIPWYKQKTTWTAVAGIAAAIGGYLTGEISMSLAVGGVLAALVTIFGRQGIEKSTYIPKMEDRGEVPENLVSDNVNHGEVK
jgi:hypothetical protein